MASVTSGPAKRGGTTAAPKVANNKTDPNNPYAPNPFNTNFGMPTNLNNTAFAPVNPKNISFHTILGTVQTTFNTAGLTRLSLSNATTTSTSSKVKQATSVTQITPIVTDPDSTYQWNLPPHKWSLPVDPGSVSDSVTAPGDASALHTRRRGLIFVGRKYVGATTSADPKTGKPVQNGLGTYQANYGFQFVWNPETFSQNTQVNWGVTPAQNDTTSGLTGLVASNSTINFTLRLDRTNDFAAAKALFVNWPANNPGVLRDSWPIPSTNANTFASYYQYGQAPGSAADFAANMDDKITDLLKRGTEADLEFLYRAINGDGFSYLGVDTSNISYLMPTVIRLDLGPQRLVGMIQSIGVTHLAFTRDMIPIRSDVAISIDLKANTQYANSNTQATGAAATNVPGGKTTP
jgi:hypothetical protein